MDGRECRMVNNMNGEPLQYEQPDERRNQHQWEKVIENQDESTIERSSDIKTRQPD